MKYLRLAILGSGRGSNCDAILNAIANQKLSAEVVVIASDQPGSGILKLAADAGIPTIVVEEPRFKSRLSPEVERSLVDDLLTFDPDLVVLAGYMRVVKDPLLKAFPNRIVNIHPSLLPAFPGLCAWKQAVDAGVAVSGCTVHWVDAGIDSGVILAQSEVPVFPEDSPDTLHARIQAAEHTIYPAVLQSLAEEWKL